MKPELILFPLLRHMLPNMCRRIAFLCLLFFYCSNITTAQPPFKGILWVVPTDPSALPINNTLTGNTELNKLFEDFHVADYYFLANFDYMEPVYEIRLEEEYADLEIGLWNEIGYCFKDIFYAVGRPYWVSPNNDLMGGISILPSIIVDPSLQACSPTRSCNEELNAILDYYNIYHYIVDSYVLGGDTLDQIIRIACDFDNVVDLYFNLLPLMHLFEAVLISMEYGGTLESYPCSYNEVPTETVLPIVLYPNPVHDHLYISGISSQAITLYDAQGKVVLTQTDHSNSINMSQLPQGLYLLHIISDMGTVYVQKLIKQ